MKGNNASQPLLCEALRQECFFRMAGGEGQRVPLQQGVLRPLTTTYLEGQQRTNFSLTGAAAGVMSKLAVSWFLVERFFLEAFRRF